MTGQFIEIVHQCVTPKVKREYGEGTIWACECTKVWTLRYSREIMKLVWMYQKSDAKGKIGWYWR